MRILLLTHSFNSLAQRLLVELRARGYAVSVELDIADAVTREAIELFRPDVLLAPFLKRALPESVWRSTRCLIVHPGIVGDRGPSSLDWAILERQPDWGVTVLQANAEMDAGDIWASVPFAMRAASKSSIYRNEVATAALEAVLLALDRFDQPGWPQHQPAPDLSARGRPRAAMRQDMRRIDWNAHDTATIWARCAASDGYPGALDTLFGKPCHLFDVHAATETTLRTARALAPTAAPGDVVARRDSSVLRLTRDGALWIGHAKPAWDNAQNGPAFKLPVGTLFSAETSRLPELVAPLVRPPDEWGELRYTEDGRVGLLAFDFCNGAMSTRQCERLRTAVAHAKTRPIHVLLLTGGADFFSNGIHLNVIEAADSPADESMRNIEAMDDLVLEILTATQFATVSVLRGNAGAGGAFLALAGDEVWALPGVMLNLHYKNMGNLYGSEYWTYTLPKRVGAERARAIVQGRLPLAAAQARELGLVDAVLGRDAGDFDAQAQARGQALPSPPPGARRPSATGRAPGREGCASCRRRSDQAARTLSRGRTGAHAAQLLRLRHELPRGALSLRAQAAACLDAAPPRRAPRHVGGEATDRARHRAGLNHDARVRRPQFASTHLDGGTCRAGARGGR
jgi:putative two-component system protein, hydrogenase maturation factor HypX/HoxX